MATARSPVRRVLVVGAGGREHALALRLLESPGVQEVLVCPGNAGTGAGVGPANGKRLRRAPGTAFDVAVAEAVDLVVIGPEAPLCAGLADELGRAGVLAYGPSAEASRLEGSKAFMKDFTKRHHIPTAEFRVVRSVDEGKRALGGFAIAPVVKADGLCAGKGVVVAGTHREAEIAMVDMLSGRAFGDAGRVVVLEERLSGLEVSLHAVCDGERSILLPMVQDHKRIGDDDRGPNTGGMGTYGPVARVSAAQADALKREFVDTVVRGMAEEGTPFRGTLFAGLMIDGQGTARLLEINVRFGDPETQVLMNVIDGDLAEALAAAAAGSLGASALAPAVDRHALCVVMAAAGYPGVPRAGDAIDGLEQAAEISGVHVYHAGTRIEGGRTVTAGGRVLGVTGIGLSLAEARARAYQAVEQIRFGGVQYRLDIGASALGGSR